MNTPAFGILFAVIAAVSFALWNILLQRSLEQGASAGLCLVAMNVVYLVMFFPMVMILWLAGTLPAISLTGIAWYAGAGLMTSVIGPFLTAKATGRIGVSLTTALRLLDPLFAVVMAILLLGEQLSLQVGLGIGLIILSLIPLQLGRSGHAEAKSNWAGIGLGILSSFSFSVGSVARKFGLLLLPSAFVAALVEGLVGLPTALLMLNRRNWGELGRLLTAGSRDMWLSGLCAAIGTLCLNLALQRLPVPVAVALRNTSPWFALFLVPIMIGQSARAGRKVVGSTIAMTAGMLLIVLR